MNFRGYKFTNSKILVVSITMFIPDFFIKQLVRAALNTQKSCFLPKLNSQRDFQGLKSGYVWITSKNYSKQCSSCYTASDGSDNFSASYIVPKNGRRGSICKQNKPQMMNQIQIRPLIYIKNQSTQTPQHMKSVLHQKLNEIIAYIRPLLLQGVDITGLYIFQAHLTSFKTVVKPISILTSLFSSEQLMKMLAITQKRVDQLKQMYGRYEANGKQTEFDDIQRFNLSVKDFNKQPLEDLAVLAKQLLETLQEWEIIQTKTQRFRTSLQNQNISPYQVYTNEQLKDQLQIQLQMLALYNNEKEFKITESTECFSSFEQQQIAVNLKRLGEADVSMMFQYIVRWSNEVYHEIQDFKALIEITKDEKSSVDIDLQNFMPRATEFTYGSLKVGKQKKQTSNVDHKTKASSKVKTNKQNLKKGQLKSVSFQMKSTTSDFDKIKRQTGHKDHSSKVFSDFGNTIIRRKQIKNRINEKECCKCEIF